ncbi:restriction endonuclease [Salinigranum halophilum]|uniref:restriction endonuclease n=1 Tax=Salinigranum halophilum TaxID=2565931 RepID=UPI0013762F85|nr:restriction endonuclease [Salinigranum halophilum]
MGIIACSTVLVDAVLIRPDLERRAVTRSINAGIRSNLTPESVLNAGSRTLRLAQALLIGARVTHLSDYFPHPANDRERFSDTVDTYLTTGGVDEIQEVQQTITAAAKRAWTQDDLLQFSPPGFEHLLGTYWSTQEHAVRVTQESQDCGVDLFVRTTRGNTLAVQAKRYDPDNPVGISTVQRTAGLREDFDVDRCLVVTSGRFTQQARQSAARNDAVSLVPGGIFTEWLTSSSLAPPVNLGDIDID